MNLDGSDKKKILDYNGIGAPIYFDGSFLYYYVDCNYELGDGFNYLICKYDIDNKRNVDIEEMYGGEYILFCGNCIVFTEPGSGAMEWATFKYDINKNIKTEIDSTGMISYVNSDTILLSKVLWKENKSIIREYCISENRYTDIKTINDESYLQLINSNGDSIITNMNGEKIEQAYSYNKNKKLVELTALKDKGNVSLVRIFDDNEIIYMAAEENYNAPSKKTTISCNRVIDNYSEKIYTNCIDLSNEYYGKDYFNYTINAKCIGKNVAMYSLKKTWFEGNESISDNINVTIYYSEIAEQESTVKTKTSGSKNMNQHIIDLYSRILEESQCTPSEINQYAGCPTFSLFDFDKDGIPELLVWDGNGVIASNWNIFVYKYNSNYNSADYVGTMLDFAGHSHIGESIDKKGIIISTRDKGTQDDITKYTLKDNKIVSEVLRYRLDETSEEWMSVYDSSEYFSDTEFERYYDFEELSSFFN